jgi:hypothetical protein
MSYVNTCLFYKIYVVSYRGGRAIAQAVSRRHPGFEPRSCYVGFVVDKVVHCQVFSEYFGFPCQFSFYRLLHNCLLSGAGTTGQLVADVPNGLSLTPPQETRKKKLSYRGDNASCSLHIFLI